MSLAAAADCSKSKCEGNLRQPHDDPDGYNFITTTQVYHGAAAHVEVYYTCVENGAARDMEFNWFIPGPNTTVPKGVACSNPRPKLTRNNAPSYGGCLYYGNGWTRDRATFIPHVDDQQKIDAEKQDPQCKTLPTKVSSKDENDRAIAIAALKDVIATQVDAFVPSNPADATKTMAYVSANVTLQSDPKDPNKYLHTIELSSTSFRDSRPDLTVVRVIPEKNDISDFYSTNVSSFTDVNQEVRRDLREGSIPLASKIRFAAELPIPKSPKLDTVRFSLVPPGGKAAATLFVPYLVESN